MSLCNREASVVRLSVCLCPSVCLSVCKLCANRYFYHRSGWIATKLAHDGPTWACIQGVLKVKVEGHVIRALLWCRDMFTIQYLLTFCLSMHSLYEAPLRSPSSTSVRRLDVMSTSWNELLRHWRSGWYYVLYDTSYHTTRSTVLLALTGNVLTVQLTYANPLSLPRF